MGWLWDSPEEKRQKALAEKQRIEREQKELKARLDKFMQKTDAEKFKWIIEKIDELEKVNREQDEGIQEAKNNASNASTIATIGLFTPPRI